MSSTTPLWTPSHERISASNLQQFIAHVNMQGEAIDSYSSLHQWSVAETRQFWLEVWQFCDVIGYRGNCIIGEGLPRFGKTLVPARDSIWFPQAQLNYAENLLSYAFQNPDGIALWFKNEMAIPRNSVGSSCVIMFPSFNSGWHKMALERVMSWLAIFPTYPKP